MPTWNRAVIVGAGLLGGSIGLALKQRGLAKEVFGVARRRTTIDTALRRGAIDQGSLDISELPTDFDLAVICTPVQQIAPDVLHLAPHCTSNALVTDVGSTKATIVRQLEKEKRFVGAHPLAGSEKSGPEHADGNLFVDRLTIITPTDRHSAEQISRTEAFWKSLGSRTLRLSAEDHDEAVARTSHLPHLIASALSSATPVEHLGLVASGWRDCTRVAGGDPHLWAQIVAENRAPVLRAIENFATVLQEWKSAIQDKDTTQLELLLLAGKKIRDEVVGS